MLAPYPQWKTIAELLRERARMRPNDLAISVVGNGLTYAELDRLSDRVGANLAALGVEKGDRVASFAYNCIEQVLVWFGCMKIGAIWVPFNIALVGADLKYTLDDAAPKVVVVDSETRPRIDALIAREPYDLELFEIGQTGATSFQALLDPAPAVPEVPIAGSDPAVIMYTGGTTGMPKGVTLPQLAWIAAGYRYYEAFEVAPTDVHFSVLSLFHNGGLMIGVIGPLVSGIPTHIERWFSVSNFWRRVRETGATIIDPIGTMVTLLCQQPAGLQERDHKARVSVGVLNQLPEDVARQFRTRFGVGVVNVYSLSESGGVLIVYNKADTPKPAANGKAWGWCEIQIVDSDDNPLPPGQIGEICLRPTKAFTFMLDYYNQPQKTVETWRNFWLHTGDLGHLDEDGFLYFIGRQSHWLRTGGENVSAYEVENIIAQYEGVEEAVVVGVPSPLGEEDVKAFIKVKDGSTVDAADLVKWCETQLAAFKLPRYIQFVSEFPRSVAKREVERHKLKAMSNEGAWDGQKIFGRRSMRSRRT